jgi:molybdate transport system permease protein
VLSFARALGEFGATAVLAGNVEGRTRTIALAVYTLLESPGGEDGIGVLLWASIAISLAAIAGYEWFNRWQRRRLDEPRRRGR